MAFKDYEQLKRLSHHAYCIVGGIPVAGEIASILSTEHGIDRKNNSDFFEKIYEIFTIEDARELNISAKTKPTNLESRRVFVLIMNGITVEAQNALLKLLEEPAEYAHFFLIVPTPHILLPTIKSRVLFIGNMGNNDEKGNISRGISDPRSEISEMARKMISLNTAKRIEIVRKLAEDISKEKRSKEEAIDLLNELERLIYEKDGARKGQKALMAIDTARKYARDRSPSIKMLLEYAILSL